LAKNQALIQAIADIAAEKGVTAAQLAIAWVLAKSPLAIPTLGARKRSQLNEALGALSIQLSQDDLRRIETAVPAAAVAGPRYAEMQMRGLDSEKR
jgi:aryl-alcohol dehydrogenase-like predicted oxidoreductase